MKKLSSSNALCLIIGMIIGIIVCGLTVLNGVSNSKQHYDNAVREFVNSIDEDYLMDVLVETDAFANLCDYVDLSAE